ncbi:MAG: choice-of-anchor D domain [Flavobacteriales bacterium]|nr:MAG: choice-of-anchor D domain [Flavobacteriales bacterium]
MNKILSIISFLSMTIAINGQTIADARNQAIGQTVTITGVATNGPELGPIRYIQDGTAGLPAYGSNLSSIQRGDSVTATGVLFEFSGLLELSPTTSYSILGQGTLPQPLLIPITSANESLEGQLVQIDNVTFVQSGVFANGSSTVQITDGSNTLDVRINGSTDIDGTAVPTGPVSIVALLGQFNANHQLIPRDLNDISPYVAPAREINIKLGGNNVLNNETYVVGNTPSTVLTVENTGSEDLTISSVSFSGTNSGDFTTDLNPTVIGPLSSQNFSLNYAASTIGSVSANLTIGNDDDDENPYTINLEAVGTDNLATEPTSNPSALNFTNVKPYTLSGEYSGAVNAEQYLVLWKNGSPITESPVDATSYLRGDYIGDAKVAYVGSGTSFTPRGIIANQNYYFKIFAFNGSDDFENYKQDNPTEGQVSSLGSQIGNYYDGISSSSPSLVSDLTDLINPHNYISYFLYKTTVMSQFEVKDTLNGQSYVTCCYSGENKVFNDPFDWSDNDFSREHTYAHSWMPTFPCNNPEQEEYADQHNLYPANLPNANTPRSNLPLEDITGSTVFTYLEGSVGYNDNNQLVYEPRESHKGNAARAIMYMATCYNGINGSNWSIPSNQGPVTLRNWHFNDLPDNYEIARHEFIYNLQGNRNPFIDSVDFACFIDFQQMTYDNDLCENLGLLEIMENNFSVFPIPAKHEIYAQINGLNISSFKLTNTIGKILMEESNLNAPVLKINSTNISKGTYILSVSTEKGSLEKKIIIE